MSLLSTILRELRHHGVQSMLAIAGLAVAVALLMAVRLTSTAAERETRRVMRDLGFNLRIVARDTDPDRFWKLGYSDLTLPASTVEKLAAQHGIFVTFNHLTPTLERRFPVGSHEALLTGLGPAVVGPGEKKQPMGFVIASGHAYLGAAVARMLGVDRGATMTLADRSFTVDRVLAESGTEEDIRLYTSLADAQALLSLPGQISEIKAVDCLCLTAEQDPLAQLRTVLARVLPEARVLQVRHLADARARQRQMSERYSAFAVPGALTAAALWIGLFMILNVRERRAEIGLWRALGWNSLAIASLFLGRAMILGLTGAAIGSVAGTALALVWGPAIFPVTAGAISANYPLMGWAILLTPLLAAVASFLPAMMAVAQDPADCLRAD